MTLSLATTYLYFIYLLDAIATSFIVLYRPPRNAPPILPSIILAMCLCVFVCVCIC